MKAFFRKYLDSTDVTNALKATIAIAFPAIIASFNGYVTEGITLAIGAYLTFPTDVPSNFKNKISGLLVSIFLISIVNLLLALVFPYPILLFVTLGFVTFGLAMLAVFGQRASLVSFAVLMSVSLSFAHPKSGSEMWIHFALLLSGGLFYMFVSLVFYFIQPHRYSELRIAECMQLTANYLKLRGDLWEINSDRKEITKKQLHLQVELNEIQEKIRELLVENREKASATRQNQKTLIVFVNLVEIMELGIATSFNHNKLHQKFDSYPPVLNAYKALANALASVLYNIVTSVETNSIYTPKINLSNYLLAFADAITAYKNYETPEKAQEGALMLANMLHYAEKQVEKIKTIQIAYTSKTEITDIKYRYKDLEKFINPPQYTFQILLENCSLSSSVFRHAIRLSCSLLVGYSIGVFFTIENAYWVLLTIVVILRQEYGSTKARTYERIFGTLLGAAIAFSILFFANNDYILSGLVIISMFLGFSFAPKNYKIGATFITIYIIFIFAMIAPEMESLIKNRIVDTLVGACIAIVFNYILFPSWEFLNIAKYLQAALEAHLGYINQISVLYKHKTEVDTNYRIARKNAFIAVGNLMASFERMLQEPKSKQNNKTTLYKITALNNALLSAEASLGSFIQSHKTTEASEAFERVLEQITQNLQTSVRLLQNNEELVTSTEASNGLFIALKKSIALELQNTTTENQTELRLKMEEAQLIVEQLIWLHNVTENITKTTKVLVLNSKKS